MKYRTIVADPPWEHDVAPLDGPRAMSDAAHLTEETDASLEAMIAAPTDAISEMTRELARLELEARKARA